MLTLRGAAIALVRLTVALLMLAYPLAPIALVICAAMLTLRGTAIALVRVAITLLLLVLIATKLLFDLVLDLLQ
jgi:hypothetical protein